MTKDAWKAKLYTIRVSVRTLTENDDYLTNNEKINILLDMEQKCRDLLNLLPPWTNE